MATDTLKIQTGYTEAADPARLQRFADGARVTRASLLQLGVGYAADYAAWTVPMYDGAADAKGRLRPCGWRVRADAGGPWGMLPGSANGLYLPTDLADALRGSDVFDLAPHRVFVVSGDPFRVAAVRSCGFLCLGRPNTDAAVGTLTRLFRWLNRPLELVVVGEWGDPVWVKGEPDYPGIRGALDLCGRLCGMERNDGSEMFRPLRFVMAPKGGRPDWGELEVMRGQAVPVTDGYLLACRKRLDAVCKEAKDRPTTPTG